MSREKNFEIELFHEFILEVVERQRKHAEDFAATTESNNGFNTQLLDQLEEMSTINLFQSSIEELEKLNMYWQSMNELTKKIVELDLNKLVNE